MSGEETDDNPLVPQAGLLQDASGSHGPMSTPLESPLQSPLLASTPLTERELLSEGSKRLEFKYDFIGRRVSKQVWTHTGGSWTDESTTAFVYDGWNLIEEVSTSSQTASINHYTWGLDLSLSLHGAGGVGGLLSVVCAPFTESGLIGDWLLPIGYVSGPAPSTFHYTFDLNGNVSELLDSTGSIAAHYEYGPFGEMLSESISPTLSGVEGSRLSFRFSTKYYDAELKTYYYGYRYYSPSMGRFLNRDPIGEAGGLNLYGFVGNDPVNRWDYLGLEELEQDVEFSYTRRIAGGVSPGGHPVSGSDVTVDVKVKVTINVECISNGTRVSWQGSDAEIIDNGIGDFDNYVPLLFSFGVFDIDFRVDDLNQRTETPTPCSNGIGEKSTIVIPFEYYEVVQIGVPIFGALEANFDVRETLLATSSATINYSCCCDQ